MSFVRDDWTLFRNLGTLGQKAGVGRERLAALVLRELADNELDAGGTTCWVGKGPADNEFFVEGDGPGIEGDDEAIANLFSIRRPLTSTKLLRLPTRGALGNGLRVVAGAVAATGGSICVRTRGRILELRPQDDGSTAVVDRSISPGPGTRVDVRLGPALDCQYALWMAELAVRMRGESSYSGKSSPHWYDSDSFFELLLAHDGELWELLDLLAGKYPTATARVDQGLPSLDVPTRSVDRQTADQILLALRGSCREPKPSVLGAVGQDALYSNGYSKKAGTLELWPAIGRLPAHVPFVVECWVRRLERGEKPRAQFYVNRTPVASHASAGAGRRKDFWISGCGIDHVFKGGADPFQVHVCVTTPFMQITTDGKDPNLLPLVGPVSDAIESACRKGRRAVAAEAGGASSKIDRVRSVLEDAMDAASGNRKHRFSLRQLYYAVRPLLQALGDEEELTYTYFAQIVTKVESAAGADLPGVYRDARGTLYHPHTGEQISVGTLAVEKYQRPKWTFNKILYVEKGGFFPLLVDEKWAERHDCALLTSQGFATRAARDVIDLLGDTDEAIRFYCVHDADAYGTNIHEKLVEATLARPGRRVEVVNLGLEPWEAEVMGLLSETISRKKDDDVGVAAYVRRYDRENGTDWRGWLQHNRYELNAMSSPEFLSWLDGKMEGLDGKVVPPTDVLVDAFRAKVEEQVRELILARLAREHRVDEKVASLLSSAMRDTVSSVDLEAVVRERFEDSPEQTWKKPVEDLATEKAREVVG